MVSIITSDNTTKTSVVSERVKSSVAFKLAPGEKAEVVMNITPCCETHDDYYRKITQVKISDIHSILQQLKMIPDFKKEERM